MMNSANTFISIFNQYGYDVTALVGDNNYIADNKTVVIPFSIYGDSISARAFYAGFKDRFIKKWSDDINRNIAIGIYAYTEHPCNIANVGFVYGPHISTIELIRGLNIIDYTTEMHRTEIELYYKVDGDHQHFLEKGNAERRAIDIGKSENDVYELHITKMFNFVTKSMDTEYAYRGFFLHEFKKGEIHVVDCRQDADYYGIQCSIKEALKYVDGIINNEEDSQ